MNGRFWAEFWLVLVLLVIATGLLAHTGADMAFASLMYRDGGWPTGEQFPWKLLYKIDRTPAIIVAFAGLVAAISGLFRQQMRSWIRPGFFLVLLLALGPGVLVNSILKEHWGRPRPRDVVEFGGKKPFLQPWQPGISGNGRSFPSGHSSAAFYLGAPYLVYRSRKPVLAMTWLVGGISFGILMSIARIAQGGHFLTDTLWSFGMVALTGLLLAKIFRLDEGKIGGQQ